MKAILKPCAGAVVAAMLMAGCASGPGSGGNGGQGQGMPAQSQGTSVIVVGNVAHPVIPWRDGLTLMQAFAMSGYQGFSNPSQLGIVRKKQMPMYMDYQKLYDGQDLMLEPGDQIEIRP